MNGQRIFNLTMDAIGVIGFIILCTTPGWFSGLFAGLLLAAGLLRLYVLIEEGKQVFHVDVVLTEKEAKNEDRT